jgi:transcriptional regulator with XRE-family HTH domain|uniref:Helix-turn-helix domain protein n=1 Tax=Ackermannviridae sp. TaxID=2831612 RepID=A0A8S5VVW8_9CAUD|nr:MAG TPA: helix-turn-helix domain protein [Ackermannviridae sp.]
MSEQKTPLDNAPIDNAPIIKRIEILLAVKEATKADFYKQTSVSSATYAQWNANQYKPSRKKLQAIAEYFGVTVDYLLTGEQKENPTSVAADGVDELDKEALNIMHQLPPEKRAAGLAMLRGLLNN